MCAHYQKEESREYRCLTAAGIRVKDLERSVNFYTKVLGIKEDDRSKIEQLKGETVTLTTDERASHAPSFELFS